VDDFLPFDTSRNPCCSYSTSRELWVSLIEKAYLKVHGGYGFPGTNSGVVLLALAGWMPESFDNSVLRVNARDKADAWQRYALYLHCFASIAFPSETSAQLLCFFGAVGSVRG
jgi:hypothetical protein